MPNRQDMNMVLGQMDELGNTLMKNRVLKQQEQERNDLMGQRERFQQTDTNLRTKQLDQNAQMHKDQMQTNSDWKTQADDQHTLQIGIKANADGSMDEAGRQKFNQWILAHPKLAGTGIQLIAPPMAQKGRMETSQTRNLEQLRELQAQIAAATTPAEKQQAEQDLASFKELLHQGPADDTEKVTEEFPATEGTPAVPPQPFKRGIFSDTPATEGTPAVPAQPKRSVSYNRPRGETGKSAGKGKALDANTAAQLLKEAGGNKDKARKLAAERGYSF